jgi:hypothetical protein
LADPGAIAMTSEDVLTPRQQRAIVAVLECDSRELSAKAAGIAVRTLQRWMALPAFAAELGRQRAKLLDATATELIRGSVRSARSLVAMATGDQRATAPRVAAARAVVDLARLLEERTEFIARLEQVEAQVAKQTKGTGATWRQ